MLDRKEGWVAKWCFQIVVLEKTLKNLLDCKEIKPVNPNGNQPRMFIGRTLLKLQYFGFLMQELTHWKTPWCWKRLKTKGEGSSRRWDDWMASLTQWTWNWTNSERQREDEADILQSIRSQGVGQNLVIEQQQL